MYKLYFIGIIFLSTLATGCASIVSGSSQSVSVETRKKGAQVTNANCKLTNEKGTWFVTSPGSVTVNRSYSDIVVRCEKEGTDPGLLTAKSSTKGMAFGNILFGGVIGAGVDMSTGAAYDYPSLLTIEMGESVFPASFVALKTDADALKAGTKTEISLDMTSKSAALHTEPVKPETKDTDISSAATLTISAARTEKPIFIPNSSITPGVMVYSAEKLAMGSGCITNNGVRPAAITIQKDGSLEVFDIECSSQHMMVRCEYQVCRLMK